MKTVAKNKMLSAKYAELEAGYFFRNSSKVE